MVKIHFHVVPPLVYSSLYNNSILGKSYQFGQPIILLESTNPEVTKSPYIFYPPREAKKGISSWTNTSVQRCLYPLF